MKPLLTSVGRTQRNVLADANGNIAAILAVHIGASPHPPANVTNLAFNPGNRANLKNCFELGFGAF